MTRLLVAFLTIYMLTFLTGCQASPAAVIERESANAVTDKKQDNLNIPDFFVRSFDAPYSEELVELQKVALAEGDIYHVQVSDTVTFNKLLESYKIPKITDWDANYFEKNTIITIFPGQHQSSISYEIERIYREENNLYIEINKLVPYVVNDDLTSKVMFVSINKALLSDIEKFDLYINTKVAYDEDSKSTLTMDDLQLGRLKLKMTTQQAEEVLKAQPGKIIKEQNALLEKRFYEDIELNIQNNEVIYISTTSDEYSTPRGLKVGDSVEKLLELYGAPSQIFNNVYSFDLSEEYYLFHAEIKDGKIIRLQVNLAC